MFISSASMHGVAGASEAARYYGRNSCNFHGKKLQQRMWKYLRNERCLKANVINKRASLSLKLSSWRDWSLRRRVHRSWQIFAHFYAAFRNCIGWRMKNSLPIARNGLWNFNYAPVVWELTTEISSSLGQWKRICWKIKMRQVLSGRIVINVPFFSVH